MSRDSGPNVFQRGVMALILLSLLRREDMYGYQLVQETERRSGGRLKPRRAPCTRCCTGCRSRD